MALYDDTKRVSKLMVLAGLSFFTFALPACKKTDHQSTERQQLVQSESERLNNWFQNRFDDQTARSPMSQTYLGIAENQDKLDDVSQLAIEETFALTSAWLDELRRDFDIQRLDETSKLSYRLFEYSSQEDIETHRFADRDYVFQHMSGEHSGLPTFIMNYHLINSVDDAENYVSRLNSVETYIRQLIDRADAQAQKGILLPKFVYAKLRQTSLNIVTGEPFNSDGESPLWSDVSKKIDELEDVSEDQKDSLKSAARTALLTSVQPAYIDLIEMFTRHESMATDDAGVWKFPEGDAYYQSKLKQYTTTEMSADEIHNIGLEEVARIQEEMRDIMKVVEFDGDLQEFFTFLRTDSQFTFEDTDSGRSQYIDQATDIIESMKEELDSLFMTKPKADMIVKRVEPYREESAFGAFYNRPAPDGSRPGAYYINLKDMSELPIYQMQALAYHEGIPGHHMQLAIGMELEGLPKFRTLGGHTAYIEGWALYAESVPKELGLYTDPYQDFGRLSMEIFRAARLVVDTGIHSKKWTREQAIDYMMKNTANSEGDIRSEVDRYIVWPGQATAYKIGMLKIQELRKFAENKLGDKFDIREFHDVILANGSVPLTVLEELVIEWIDQKTN